MTKAIWNNVVLAESNKCKIIEDSYYFPPNSIKKKYFRPSSTHTTCPWKGQASYYDIVLNGEVNKDAAWCYPNPKQEAKDIKDFVAFWKGVEVAE